MVPWILSCIQVPRTEGSTKLRVGVMVDGAHHFPAMDSRGMHVKGSRVQAAIDERFNAEIMAQIGSVVKGVVRLHCKDGASNTHVCVALWCSNTHTAGHH